MKKLKLLLATLVCITLTSCYTKKNSKVTFCTFEGSECSWCIPYNEDIIKAFNCKYGSWETECIDKEKGHYHIRIEMYGG